MLQGSYSVTYQTEAGDETNYPQCQDITETTCSLTFDAETFSPGTSFTIRVFAKKGLWSSTKASLSASLKGKFFCFKNFNHIYKKNIAQSNKQEKCQIISEEAGKVFLVTVTLDADCNEESTDLTRDAAMDVASKIKQSVRTLCFM